MRKVFLFAFVLSFTVFLSACDTLSGLMPDSEKPALPGERLSILELQRDLAPDPALLAQPVALPEAWTNQFWPQAGGYSNHTMGQLTLGADLKEVWHESIGVGGSRRNPLITGPIVAENMVFTLDTDGDVSAFDMNTGARKWRQSIIPRGESDTGAVGGGLAYASGKIFVSNGYKQLVALNATDGARVWKVDTISPVRSAPTVAEDRVYVTTLDNKLFVYAVADGSPLWNFTGVDETTNLLGSASVAVDQSVVVLPLSSGELYGLRPENGQVVWEDNLSAVRRSGTLSSISDIRGLPVIDQGVVFAASYSGRLVAIDQVSGQRLWQREVGSAETTLSAGDHVYTISADQQLAALTRANGAVRWVLPLPRFSDSDRNQPIVWTGPLLAGGRLLAASSSGMLVEVNPQDGKILRQTKLSGDVTIPPIVASNMLFVLTTDGRLSVYK